MAEHSLTDKAPARPRAQAKWPAWLVTEAPVEIPEEPRRRPYVGIGLAVIVSILLWVGLIAALAWLF